MPEEAYDEEEFEEKEDDEDAKKFTFKGKVYLKGIISNIVYEENVFDEEYGNNVIVGKWYEKTNTIRAM